MKYPCIESTIEFKAYPYWFRFWINEKKMPDVIKSSEDLIEQVRGFIETPLRPALSQIIDFCAKLPNINAVQIKQGDAGIVVYTVDFENHG